MNPSAPRQRDHGLEAVQRIADLWQVGDQRVKWDENGFSWWPGRFEVRVQYDSHPNEKAWRLEVGTKLLKDVACDDDEIQSRTRVEVAADVQ